MDPDVAGVLSQFKSIKGQAIQVQQSIRDYLNRRTPGYRSFFDVNVLNSLIEEFKDAKIHFDRIRYKQNFRVSLRNIKISRGTNETAILREIEVECDKAIGVLESIATPLSKDELDKLSSLREELEKLSEVLPDINYGRNLEEAIDEYEKGDFLVMS